MFKVDFFVDDKKLGAALLALVGIAHGQPGVVPVVNAAKKGNGLVAKVSGSAMDQFAEQLKSLKGKPFRGNEADGLVKAIGLSVTSRSYMLKRACEAGLVKKRGTGSGSTYTVL